MDRKRNRKCGQKQKRIVMILCMVLAVLLLALCGIFIWKHSGQARQAENVTSGEKKGKTEITERKDADYEKWLAAGMVAAVSMQYPDFEVSEIYLASSVEINEKSKSQGVYIVFHTDSQTIALHSEPLENERTEEGSVDLYTRDLGFATFDKVNIEEIDVSGFDTVSMESLEDRISQSVLVSVYEH